MLTILSLQSIYFANFFKIKSAPSAREMIPLYAWVHLKIGAKGGKIERNLRRGFADEKDTRTDEARIGEKSR